jgi:hypothetical protein
MEPFSHASVWRPWLQPTAWNLCPPLLLAKAPNATHPDQAVLGLKLLGGLQVVVDETKASGLATTELHGCGDTAPKHENLFCDVG